MISFWTDACLISKPAVPSRTAFAPYSGFAVGAALMAENGRIFKGANVENVSYGLTMCAERVAVGSAIQSGANKFARLAIVSDSKEPVVPCGACRQVLAEFSPGLDIITSNLAGQTQLLNLATLLPLSRQGILD